MCGIYGQWDLAHRPLDLSGVQRATARLRHRGPDDEGYLLADSRSGRCTPCAGPDTTAALGLPDLRSVADGSTDLAFGFRRLAIVDLSPAGHQPMASADGRFWLVFNGEVYNYRELRSELTALGVTFRSDSDTEVVLAAYAAWGARCLERFNGMWALAIWDARERALFLARDRFGVKPLLYAWGDRRFRFASELKALLGADGVPFAPSAPAVHDYLTTARLPSEPEGATFVDGVCALPPGHLLRLSDDGLHVERWYRLPPASTAPARPAAQVVADFREILADAVRLRVHADVPVGSCLSGGLDSSAIVCLVNRMLGGADAAAVGDRQKTFSAVYEEDARYNERPHVETVLAATGADGVFTVPTAEQLRAELPSLVWHQDEPFNSTSIFAQWRVMAAVRQHGVTVLLDGQGADESLGGYRPFDIVVSDLLRRGQVARALRAGRAMGETAGVALAPLLARAVARNLPTRYVRGARRRRAGAGRALLRPAFAARQSTERDAAPPYRDFHAYAHGLIERESLPALLRYEDRNSMAFSIEGRVPFLDYRLVEFALTDAAPWVLHDGWTKWVLRSAVRDVVPPSIVWRRDKVGFETPERRWITAWLDGEGASLFADGARSGEYLDLAAVREYVARWRAGGGDVRQLWRCINLELWLRAFA